jgi:hypothetical protein
MGKMKKFALALICLPLRNLSNMKNRVILFCILAVSGVACQKELTDDGGPAFWALTDVIVTDVNTKAVLSKYEYEYDSISMKASKLLFQNPVTGATRTIYPSYSTDTVFLCTNSYLVVDASKRVKQLSEFNARPGVVNGEYFYDYNGEGQLQERLYDDGATDAIRTTFNYNNGDLVQYSQDFKGYPLANTASLTYLNTPRILGFGQYSLLEIFPELLLYMPCLSIGRSVLYPLSQINSEVSLPAPPMPPYTTYYSNFVMNAQGYVTSFETSVQIGTNPVVKKHYEFTYQSFN